MAKAPVKGAYSVECSDNVKSRRAVRTLPGRGRSRLEIDVSEPTSAERWLPVPGFPDYEVSDLGRVEGLPRIALNGRHIRGRMLKATIGTHGYPVVRLQVGGEWTARTVHSLVAEAFIGPRPEGMEVRHKDGIRTHCELANLEYGTSSENQYDKVRHGTHHYARREQCSRGHDLSGANLRITYRKDGSFRQRVCIQCVEDYKAQWAAAQPPCTECGALVFAKGLCQKHYVRQRTAARRAVAPNS
jgi:hypothetical protein